MCVFFVERKRERGLGLVDRKVRMHSKNGDGGEELEKAVTWLVNAILDERDINSQEIFQEVSNKKRKRKKKKNASGSSSLGNEHDVGSNSGGKIESEQHAVPSHNEPGKAVDKEELRDASADVSSAAADFQQEEQSSQDNRTIAVCPTLTQSSKTSAVCDSLSEHLDFDARCFVNRGDEQRGFGFLRETVDDLFSSSWKEHERHILPERHQDNHTRPSVPEPSSRRQEPVNSTTSGAFVPQDKFAQSSAPQQHSANPRGYGTLPQNQPYYTRVINPQEAFPGSGAYGYHPSSAGMNYYYVPLNWNEFTPLHTWPPADSASSGYHFYGNFGFPIYNPQGGILSLDYGAGPTSMFRPYVFLRQPQHTIPLCSQRPLDFQNVSSNKPSRHWPRKR